MTERSHDDVAAALRSAWSRLPVPEGTRELHEEDGETVRAVRWVQRAWDRMPMPAPARPPARRTTVHRFASWRRHAAAAAVLLAMGAALRWGLVRDGARPATSRPGPSAPEAPVAAEPRDATDEIDAPPAPRLVAATDDRLELRSGPVRLVLLTTPADEHESPR